MIEEYFFRGKDIHLVDTRYLKHSENVFSILVGKNGTGKSTFLERITTEFYKRNQSNPQQRFYEFDGSTYNDFFPREVIAISTSPFDKFPMSRLGKEVNGYSYLGLRDLHSSNFGIAYLSKIIASLIDSIIKEPKQAFEISKVLNYLGYEENIQIRFHSNSLNKMLQDFLELETPEHLFESSRNSISRRFNKSFFLNEDESIDYEKIHHLQLVAKRILHERLNTYFIFTINSDGLKSNYDDHYFNEDILFLILSGVLRLRDVGLQSLDDRKIFSIKNASSGEQSIILSILGIASKIKDSCLICIDEPEICLHPQWQEKYIQILTNTFEKYRNCHFIIATHSPQIISKLSNVNSFIVDMETGITKNASEFINRSADFQLANIFNSPGFKNEYLNRLAFSIMSKVGKAKKFDSEDLDNFEIIKLQVENLDKNDPLLNIFSLINELKEKYA
ncbi:AAA family ATPase [Tenacibaculum finnmarkense genomovar ulcerans]|uniref:ATP-binding protein n=1 Tax=Tenacibaculum finnmarkense TaxID=2781243 RepID=UPI001E463A69|nr:ATP-binding protein [Tenacibaculum finnmarkense]MCD8454075.1 AAA family ATPase [Tenacibaculum finnmarkense genomovar ulcerans]